MDEDCVIENKTLPSLYEVPQMLHSQRLDDIVCNKLRIRTPKCNLADWNSMVEMVHKAAQSEKRVEVAMVGKYTALHDAYLSIVEALHHAAIYNCCNLSIRWIESSDIDSPKKAAQLLEGVNGILVPGGFGDRGIEGMILAAQYARENNVPYF